MIDVRPFASLGAFRNEATGTVAVNGTPVGACDGAAITGEGAVAIAAQRDSDVVMVDAAGA